MVDLAMSEDFREELRRRSARLTFVDGAARSGAGDRATRLLGEGDRSASRSRWQGCSCRLPAIPARCAADLATKSSKLMLRSICFAKFHLASISDQRRWTYRSIFIRPRRANAGIVGMNSIGAVLTGNQVGLEFRHDDDRIFATQPAGECDRGEDLADIFRRLAKECDEASWLCLFDRVDRGHRRSSAGSSTSSAAADEPLSPALP